MGPSPDQIALSRAFAEMTLSEASLEENLARYCPGGYHPVRIGDVFANGRYTVVNKLGWGSYSTVWLATDWRTKRHVALKVLTADCYGHQQDIFEVDILIAINSKSATAPGSQHVLGLLDRFEHAGPNGKHVCLVFKAMGPDMSRYRPTLPRYRIPVPLMKDITRQLLLALAFLHDTCQVIHCDIKQQNILIETAKINRMFENAPPKSFIPPHHPLDPLNDFYIKSSQIASSQEDLSCVTEISVRLAGFGTASWFTRHLTEWIQPQRFRAPEVILGAIWDYKVDIWNLGLVIWELSEGSYIFDGSWPASVPYTSEIHLAQMEAFIGRMPQSLLSRSSNRDQFFDRRLLIPRILPDIPLETLCVNTEMSEADRALFLDMIKSMLQLEPRDRPDARTLLESGWLK
ncbi:kinase-like protein [Nemania abortiva]|nr:kinase-like protein [Nemania abortiva]